MTTKVVRFQIFMLTDGCWAVQRIDEGASDEVFVCSDAMQANLLCREITEEAGAYVHSVDLAPTNAIHVAGHS